MSKAAVPATVTRLQALVQSGDTSTLRAEVLHWQLQDTAEALVALSPSGQTRVLQALPAGAAAAVFEYLPAHVQRELVKVMPHDDLAALLNGMAPDDRTLFLGELPAHASEQLLALLTPDERLDAEKLLRYPPDSVGRLMTPDYVAVKAEWTVQQVLEYIRAHGQNSETLNVIYVVDDAGLFFNGHSH